MKRIATDAFMALTCALALVATVPAGEIVLTQDEGGRGALTWINRIPGVAKFRVEWATSPDGPWSGDWDSLTAIQGTGSTHTVTVPTHFRVVATMASSAVPRSGTVVAPPGVIGRGDTAGGGEADETPFWQVYVSAFCIDKYETSNQQMRDVMQWAYTNGRISESVAALWYKNNDGLQRPCSVSLTRSAT